MGIRIYKRLKGRQCTRQSGASRLSTSSRMMERVKSHWAHVVKRKKTQGNVRKNITGRQIMKT